MFVVLPPTVFFIIFLYRLGSRQGAEPEYRPWQGEFLIAAAVWGALLVAITEGLSFFYAINRLWLAISWSIVLIVALVMGWRSGRVALGWQRMRRGFPLKSRLEYLYLGIFMSIAGLLFLVAFVSPPSNVDSLQYHMPRVVHWAQNGSLRHYAAAHQHQIRRPYWAEAAILHLRVLWGTDSPANLVQWFSMIGSVIAATGITAVLCGKRRAQWLTAAFAISIPMGVLQAATTQNDYVSAFWIVCLAYFVILSKKREISKIELLGLSLSFGLGMLTKGTFFPFAGPLMVWFFLPRVFNKGIVRVAIEGVFVAVIVLCINGAFWVRNVVTYGGLFGQTTSISMLDPDFQGDRIDSAHRDTFELSESSDLTGPTNIGNTSQDNDVSSHFSGISMGLGGFTFTDLQNEIAERLAKLARMVAMNFVSPIFWFNTRFFRTLNALPGVFPPQYIESLKMAAWNHEMTAGSPLHFFLISLSMILAALWALRRNAGYIAQYSLVAIIGYILLSLVDRSDVIFGIRYQLGFLVMSTPIFACVFAKLKGWSIEIITIGLLLYALPYVFLSNQRPVIGHTPWPTRIESIFTVDPAEALFAQSPGKRDEYMIITEMIQEEGCKTVGLSISSKDLEYTIWWLLESPQSGIIVRHVSAPKVLRKYIDPGYEPCAIVCTHCEGSTFFQDLPIVGDYGHVQLYLKPSSNP